MSKKTITKKFSFVIFTFILGCIFSGCSAVSSSQTSNEPKANQNFSIDYKKPEIVGTINTGEITESSGIAISKCQANVFWTHNDSGDGALVYALDESGKKLGTWKIGNAKNVDWEDIAAIQNADGECFLYVGDIGDNGRKRTDLAIYLVKEPSVAVENKTSNKKNPLSTEPAEIIKFEYPDSRLDAETLIVHPQSGDIYVLTKQLRGAAGVYKLSKNYNQRKTNRLEKIVDFIVPSIPNGFLTGGDVSNDGKRVIVCDYLGAYEIVLPENAKNFDEIWREKPVIIDLGEREQGEAIAYSVNGNAIYATSEKLNSPLIKVERK
jgi:hypothetical protein